MVEQLIHLGIGLLGRGDPKLKEFDRLVVITIRKVVGTDHPVSPAGG